MQVPDTRVVNEDEPITGGCLCKKIKFLSASKPKWISDMTFGGYSDGLMFESLKEAIANVDYSKRLRLHQSVDPISHK